MGETVVFVDDAKKVPEYYTAKLVEKGYAVIRCHDPDETLDYMNKNSRNIRAFILDIMMPPGEAYKDLCDDDDTGLFLYRDIRRRLPNTPVVILTNRRTDQLFERRSDDPNLTILWKPDHTPNDLVDQLENLLSP